MTTQAPLDHILHNGESLEYYWTRAGQENTGYNDYFALYKEFLELSNNTELALELWRKFNAHWCRHMNVLIDEIVHLTQGVKE
jgi:hypothetical protein